jgi:hypothetical protein
MTPETRTDSTRGPNVALLRGSEGVSLRQEANRPGDATNAPGHDTEAGTSMPDKTTARPWEGLPAGSWWAVTPRQLTGTPYVYHGYVTRDRKRAEMTCCARDHRSPKAALRCAERKARELNRGR